MKEMNRFRLSVVIVNSLGALLVFLYFNFIDREIHWGHHKTLHYVYVIFTIGLISTAVALLMRHWQSPLSRVVNGNILDRDASDTPVEEVRRKALNLVPFTALVNLLAWALAGFLFGFVEPAISQAYLGKLNVTISECFEIFADITFLGGFITSLCIYFYSENVWRAKIPLFSPPGGLSEVRGVFKLGVKSRLMILFVMISLVPLTFLGMGSYLKALALISGSSDIWPHITAGLVRSIFFLASVMLAVSLTLSVLVSRSVYKPLQNMEGVMNEVAKRNFDVHVQVVSNDEIGAVGEGFNRMIMELKQSEFIRETFGKYVSKEIRDEIIKDSTPLEGEMKRVTLLFSDLRGFTSFVESTHPKKVVTTMNQYFSEMSDAINEHRGLVLQYVGDEIEAVFGAPMTYEDHPDRAVLAAIEMRKRLMLLNQSLEKQGFKAFHHGIGVHTGVVLAGNIGSKERLSYALVGDAVNLASRIAGLTREFGSDIIVSQTTHDLLTRAFPMERVADVKVKGKKDEVTVYKLLNGP
jgi:adenylate cyclase